MYDYDANYIQAVPIKSRESTELVRGMHECYSTLTKNNFNAKIMRLDNEVSKTLIKYIEKTANLDYQLVSPHNHRANPAEHAIQTYKAYFISILSGKALSTYTHPWQLQL